MNIVAGSASFEMSERGGLKVGPVLDFAIDLAEAAHRPKVCFINTAGGDSTRFYGMQYAAINRDRPDVVASHLALFLMPNVADIRDHILSQDVVWVGGGSVVNLLAVWRAHGLDEIMREAWDAGVVLGGISAGSLCWHVGGTTDSFGPDLRAITNGLAMLPFSNTPHYDSEPLRRPTYQSLVGNGSLPPGWATDDGVALHFRGTELVEAVTAQEGKAAWRVELDEGGKVTESRVEARYLG